MINNKNNEFNNNSNISYESDEEDSHQDINLSDINSNNI